MVKTVKTEKRNEFDGNKFVILKALGKNTGWVVDSTTSTLYFVEVDENGIVKSYDKAACTQEGVTSKYREIPFKILKEMKNIVA